MAAASKRFIGRAVRRAARAGLYLALYAGAAVVLLPFVWMVLGSFKPEMEFFHNPDSLFPVNPTPQAYFDVWSAIPLGRFFVNTVIFAGGVTIISLFLDSLTAYALARLKFRGQKFLFWVVLLVLMVPFQITLVPLYLTVSQLGWLNSFAGLIVPRATNAFGIFMLRQFFLTIPRDFDEAARIDGASELRIYWSIILPLARPALGALALFHFMYNWNDFLWPLVITTTQDMRTLPAGLALFVGSYSVQHPLLLAAATITLLPLLAGFLVAQKQFIQGIASTGLK
jgi:multiple sugar transport system permease protein